MSNMAETMPTNTIHGNRDNMILIAVQFGGTPLYGTEVVLRRSLPTPKEEPVIPFRTRVVIQRLHRKTAYLSQSRHPSKPEYAWRGEPHSDRA